MSRITSFQRIAVAAEFVTEKSIDKSCRAHQISPVMFHKWKVNQKLNL